MRLATRRLHALDNVAPLTFSVCGVCDKAIMAQPYEVDGKSYHQGGCLIELGRRVTEEIWKAKELARVAAEEKAKMYDLSGLKANYPNVTYRPIITITDGTTLIPAVGPYYGGVGGTAGGNISGNTPTLDNNTILLPANLVASATSALYSRGSAATTVTTTTAAYDMEAERADWSHPLTMTAVSGL